MHCLIITYFFKTYFFKLLFCSCNSIFILLTSMSFDSLASNISVISCIRFNNFSISTFISSDPTLISLNSLECPLVFNVLIKRSQPFVDCNFCRDCVELESPFGLCFNKQKVAIILIFITVHYIACVT